MFSYLKERAPESRRKNYFRAVVLDSAVVAAAAAAAEGHPSDHLSPGHSDHFLADHHFHCKSYLLLLMRAVMIARAEHSAAAAAGQDFGCGDGGDGSDRRKLIQGSLHSAAKHYQRRLCHWAPVMTDVAGAGGAGGAAEMRPRTTRDSRGGWPAKRRPPPRQPPPAPRWPPSERATRF